MNSEQFSEACDYLDEHELWSECYHWARKEMPQVPSGEAVIKFVNMKKQEKQEEQEEQLD